MHTEDEDNAKAILTGAIFVALFVILLVSIGSAADLMPGMGLLLQVGQRTI